MCVSSDMGMGVESKPFCCQAEDRVSMGDSRAEVRELHGIFGTGASHSVRRDFTLWEWPWIVL